MSAQPDGEYRAWEELARLIRDYALRKYGFEPEGFTIHFPHPMGRDHYERLPPRRPAAPPAPAPSAPRAARPQDWASGDEPKHLTEFRAVYWPGLGKFTFSPTQARVIEQLWEAYEAGTWEVPQLDLLRGAQSDSTRLHDLFRNHPSWGVLVIRGQVVGNYRLAALTGGEAIDEDLCEAST